MMCSEIKLAHCIRMLFYYCTILDTFNCCLFLHITKLVIKQSHQNLDSEQYSFFLYSTLIITNEPGQKD